MDVAQVVLTVSKAWSAQSHSDVVKDSGATLPDRSVLERFLHTAFVASLLQEEGRTLSFRLALQSPDGFAEADGPANGIYRLRFDAPRRFTAHELRRLSPAVDYDRSLLGVSLNAKGELQIWGVIHTGLAWVEQFRGGRGSASNLPDCLILAVRNPGYLVVGRGARPLCTVEAGVLQAIGLNIFKSKWLPASFGSVCDELSQRHAAERARCGAHWAPLDPALPHLVAQQMIQRLISTIQRSRHGGTLLIVPSRRARELTQPNSLVRLKYRFAEERARARYCALIVRVMNTLAATASPYNGKTVGWDDYARSSHRELVELDEAIFELSHLMATLTAVDGAVLVTEHFELLGFGGEIAGALPEVRTVAQALDLEGETYSLETTEEVGTRHRSVYRLCNALHDVLGIVVSQDGGVRFVRWKEPHVTYWSHTTITPQ